MWGVRGSHGQRAFPGTRRHHARGTRKTLHLNFSLATARLGCRPWKSLMWVSLSFSPGINWCQKNSWKWCPTLAEAPEVSPWNLTTSVPVTKSCSFRCCEGAGLSRIRTRCVMSVRFGDIIGPSPEGGFFSLNVFRFPIRLRRKNLTTTPHFVWKRGQNSREVWFGYFLGKATVGFFHLSRMQFALRVLLTCILLLWLQSHSLPGITRCS